jgi:hexokinase
MRSRVSEFFRQHAFPLSLEGDSDFKGAFHSEMEAGLRGEKSSLAMLPTYIGVDKSIPSRRPVVVIDAGGTNLRVCKVTFDEFGEGQIDDFSKEAMPGTQGELSSAEFFEAIARKVRPILEKDASIETLGFCFSYPAEILPNRDGRLLFWTKEVRAPEVVGQCLGEQLLKKLDRPELRITVLNDTVATLLAGKAQGDVDRCSGYAGFILGTGMNTAVVEKNVDITKVQHDDVAGEQVINMESGNFSRLSQSDFDKKLLQKTGDPDAYILEKRVSGAYLGPLFHEVLSSAVDNGLFGKEGCESIAALKDVSALELNSVLNHPFRENPFAELGEEDLGVVVELGEALVQRAARLSAFQLAAALSRRTSSSSRLHPICVNVDGSTIHKMKGYYVAFESQLKSLLEEKDIHVMLVHKEHSPILGSAIAALTN